MEKILSVSVAAYNVESFIEQCLDSFIDEEILDKIEVLVTDDGSTDRTREIVERYQERYPPDLPPDPPGKRGARIHGQQWDAPREGEIFPYGGRGRLGADRKHGGICAFLRRS